MSPNTKNFVTLTVSFEMTNCSFYKTKNNKKKILNKFPACKKYFV